MPDWTEHAVTIVAVLVAGFGVLVTVIGFLSKVIWNFWSKREAEKESVVAGALDRIGKEVSAIRCELKDMGNKVFDRLAVNEREIAELKARCETRHGWKAEE